MAIRDISGQRFGRLVAVEWAGVGSSGSLWRCACDCGAVKILSLSNLSIVKSCGCLRREVSATHRMTKSPEYRAWVGMIHRCTDSSCKNFRNYGGRGISVFPEWIGPGGFSLFFAHIGLRPTPKHSLDRIVNSGNYEPGNVRWATKLEQFRNRRNTRWIEYQGSRFMASEFCKMTGVAERTARKHAKNGMSGEEMVSMFCRK